MIFWLCLGSAVAFGSYFLWTARDGIDRRDPTLVAGMLCIAALLGGGVALLIHLLYLATH